MYKTLLFITFIESIFCGRRFQTFEQYCMYIRVYVYVYINNNNTSKLYFYLSNCLTNNYHT